MAILGSLKNPFQTDFNIASNPRLQQNISQTLGAYNAYFGDAASLFNQAFVEGAAPAFQRQREQTAKILGEQALATGMYGSGQQFQRTSEAIADINARETETANQFALQIFSALDQSAQMHLDREQRDWFNELARRDAQSASNQSKRAGLQGAALGIAASYAGGGFGSFGGGGGGVGSGISGGFADFGKAVR